MKSRTVVLTHRPPNKDTVMETEESIEELVVILGEMVRGRFSAFGCRRVLNTAYSNSNTQRKKLRRGEVFRVNNESFARAASLILTNLRPLRRDPKPQVFTQRIPLSMLPSNKPQLSNSKKRALVKQFKKINKKDNGEISTFELELWLSRTVESIGDSVFLPMLTRVVPPARREFINIFEWVQMYDKFCLMKDEELLAFAFFQFASVGKEPGQFPRIVTPNLVKEFPEFELAGACHFANSAFCLCVRLFSPLRTLGTLCPARHLAFSAPPLHRARQKQHQPATFG